MSERAPAGPFVVWEDYGCEGWHPKSYDTLAEAVRTSPDKTITRLVEFKVVEMAENRAGGPYIGQDVIYTPTAGTMYAAKITAISATTGLVRLTTFPPGGTTVDQTSVQYDGTRVVTNSWSYPDLVTGQ